MSAGSLGWGEAIQEIRPFSAAGDGLLLPGPSTEIAAPQDAKLSARAPEPSEQLWIVRLNLEMRLSFARFHN